MSGLGKYYIDFSASPYPQEYYDDLLTTLLGTREKAPPIGAATKSEPSTNTTSGNPKAETPTHFEPIQITGIITDHCPSADFKMSITNSLTATYAGYSNVLPIYGMPLLAYKRTVNYVTRLILEFWMVLAKNAKNGGQKWHFGR